MIQIIPAILATNEEQFASDISKLQNSESFQEGWVHIDFMDNKFVQNNSIDTEVLKKHPTSLQIEAHLMVEHPNAWVGSLKQVGVKRAIAHIETGEQVIDDFISGCKVADIEVGLAIKMDTPLEQLASYWEVIDLVLIMSVEPGFQGQPFMPQAIERIKEIKKLCQNFDKPFMIGIDGHINDENIKSVIDAGANHIVIGSYLMKEENIDENIETLWEKINS